MAGKPTKIILKQLTHLKSDPFHHPGSSAERPAPSLHQVRCQGHCENWYEFSPGRRTSIDTSSRVRGANVELRSSCAF